MDVKKKIADTEDGMAEFKNLKVPEQTHKLLVSRADALGMKYYVLADALLGIGLEMTDQALQETVVNARQLTIKLPKADTTQEAKQPRSSLPASSDE